MNIIQQSAGSSLTNLCVDENKFSTQVVFTTTVFAEFSFDGTNWSYDGNTITTADLHDIYGILFDGTPVNGDKIVVACQKQQIEVFSPNKGINVVKLNDNFASLQQQANDNEDSITDIADTALLKDGSNLTPDIIADFQSQVPNILSTSGTISLADNSSNFLTLTGDGVISLPVVPSDQYSHTIILIVEGGNHTLDIGTATSNKHLYNDITVDPTQTYCVMFVYNKIENAWYYSLTQ